MNNGRIGADLMNSVYIGTALKHVFIDARYDLTQRFKRRAPGWEYHITGEHHTKLISSSLRFRYIVEDSAFTGLLQWQRR